MVFPLNYHLKNLVSRFFVAVLIVESGVAPDTMLAITLLVYRSALKACSIKGAVFLHLLAPLAIVGNYFISMA
jgi:hypothetical protein